MQTGSTEWIHGKEATEQGGQIEPSELLTCSECGQTSKEVTSCDMTYHPAYSFYGDGKDSIQLCNKCFDDIWDRYCNSIKRK